MSIKLIENYAINSLRQYIRESMQYHGEQCLLLQMYHVGGDLVGGQNLGLGHNPQRCPDCYDDEYAQGERYDCSLCYGTTYLGGVRQASIVWGMFTDKKAAEQYGKQGVWAPDKREFQAEPFPQLMEHDYLVRVRLWDSTNTIPLEIEGYYTIMQVTRNSLRTGGRFGQWQWDVVGQRAQISEVQKNSAIVQYPVVGETFSPASPMPAVPSGAVSGGTNVVFVQGGAAVGGEGAGVLHFTQNTPLATWVINHTLTSPYPQVNIIIDGERVEAPVSYGPGVVTIKFGSPQTGSAELIG